METLSEDSLIKYSHFFTAIHFVIIAAYVWPQATAKRATQAMTAIVK